MNKVFNDAGSALNGLLFEGMSIAAGGFGLCGIPELLIGAIRDAGTTGLTIASNNCGVDDFGHMSIIIDPGRGNLHFEKY